MNIKEYSKPFEMSEPLESRLQKMKIRKYFSRIEKKNFRTDSLNGIAGVSTIDFEEIQMKKQRVEFILVRQRVDFNPDYEL